MSIEWRDDMATGIERIDEQHRGIFQRFAEFREACETGCSREELARLVAFLEDYARDHFRDEEKALLEANYHELAAHRKSHEAFIGEITELKNRIGKGEEEISSILEMKRLLIRWLIQHIRHLDMAYVECLRGQVSR